MHTVCLAYVSFNERPSIDAMRTGSCLTLYGTTEFHVFMQLLAYRISPSDFALLHWISAYLYLFTRCAAGVITFVCFVQWCNNYGSFILNNDALEIGLSYVLFFYFVGIFNILLNLTQISSIRALFFMAEKVYKNNQLKRQLQYNTKMSQFFDIFQQYIELEESNQPESQSQSQSQEKKINKFDVSRNVWTLGGFKLFLQDYSDVFVVNDQVTQLMYQAFLLIQQKRSSSRIRSRSSRSRSHEQNTSNVGVNNLNNTNDSNDENENENKNNQMEKDSDNGESESKGTDDSKEKESDNKVNGKHKNKNSKSNRTRLKSRSKPQAQAHRAEADSGLKWKTVKYLFENELTFVQESIETKKIVTQKLNLLVGAALAVLQKSNMSILIQQMSADAYNDDHDDDNHVNLKGKEDNTNHNFTYVEVLYCCVFCVCSNADLDVFSNKIACFRYIITHIFYIYCTCTLIHVTHMYNRETMIKDYLKMIVILNQKMMESITEQDPNKKSGVTGSIQIINDLQLEQQASSNSNMGDVNTVATWVMIGACLDIVSFALLFILRCVPCRRWYRFGCNNGNIIALKNNTSEFSNRNETWMNDMEIDAGQEATECGFEIHVDNIMRIANNTSKATETTTSTLQEHTDDDHASSNVLRPVNNGGITNGTVPLSIVSDEK